MPNLWDAAKAELKGQFIAFHDYIKKERSKKAIGILLSSLIYLISLF